MSQAEKRSADNVFTPETSSKMRDTRCTPLPNKDKSPSDHLQQQINFDEPEAVDSSPESFMMKLWPLFEAKMNSWVTSTLNDLVENIATRSVNNYLSSQEFNDKVVKKVNDDVAARMQHHLDRIYPSLDESKAREDDLEQYSRRNSIRINGVPQTTTGQEDTDQIVIDLLNKELGIDIEKRDLDRSHRVGKGKPRQIIAKFVSHNLKVDILKKRGILRSKAGNKIRINEDLTSGRLTAIKEINESCKGDFKKLWTIDGAIFVRLNNDEIITLRSLTNLKEFKDKVYFA